MAVDEGNSGTTPAVFTISLAGSTQLPVTVSYATADGTGKAGTDYQSANGTLTFNPGESTKSITVLVTGNTIKQLNRTFLVNLSSAVRATVGKGQGIGTIKDDDQANLPPTVRISSPENNATFLPGSDVPITADAPTRTGRSCGWTFMWAER